MVEQKPQLSLALQAVGEGAGVFDASAPLAFVLSVDKIIAILAKAGAHSPPSVA